MNWPLARQTNPFREREEVHYLVSLPPNEVRDRLASSLGSEGFLFDTGDREFVGFVGPRAFRIRTSSHHRSARPHLYGRMERTGAGTRIAVRLGLDPMVKPFMMLWLAGTYALCLLFLAVFILGGLGKSLPENEHALILLAPPGMFVFGIAFVWFGRLLGLTEERRLLAFADELWGPRVEPEAEAWGE